MNLGTEINPTKRLESLDVLRGLTIAAMLMVNNPGSWSHIYWPLEHAAWNGWTLTDLVFPFFLFMVGMAMMFSFPKRLARGDSKRKLFLHVVRRSIALILLGWWGSTWWTLVWSGVSFGTGEVALRLGYPAAVLAAVVLLAGTRHNRRWWVVLGTGVAAFAIGALLTAVDDPLLRALAAIRIPGVLVRIAVCYLLASAIYFVTPSPRAIGFWIVGLLLGYAVWMMWVPIPGFGIPDLSAGFPTVDTPAGELFSNWAFFVDYHVLGTHTWGVRQLFSDDGALIWSFDPEGVLSTVSAVCSVLFGILAGLWMKRTDTSDQDKLVGLFVAACWLMLAGLVFSIWMPINKRIWTSSYTVFTSGMGLLTLAFLFHTIDMKGYRRWARPFRSYGRNAIFAFVASGMMATAMGRVRVGGDQSLKEWIFDALQLTFGDPVFASFMFATVFVAVWAAISWWLDSRKTYFKV